MGRMSISPVAFLWVELWHVQICAAPHNSNYKLSNSSIRKTQIYYYCLKLLKVARCQFKQNFKIFSNKKILFISKMTI